MFDDRMKVEDLIKELEKLPQDATIGLREDEYIIIVKNTTKNKPFHSIYEQCDYYLV